MTDGTQQVGIAGLGAYAPRFRLSADAVTDVWGQFHGAGVSTTAVPDADEDALTMAYEAGRRALSAAGIDAGAVTGLVLGTTTPPTEEGAVTPRLLSTLSLPESVSSRQLTGSTRAGVDALVAARDLAADGPVLAVASDAPRGAPDDEIDHAGGAGAVGAVLAPDAPGAMTATAEYSSPTPGTRFRPRGSTETTGLGVVAYDRSAFTEAVTAAVDALDVDPGTAGAVALQAPNGKLPYRAVGPLGVESEAIHRGTVVGDLGDLGAASAPFGLAAAVDDGARDVLLVGYGSGGATAVFLSHDGITVETDGSGDGEPISYGEYLRLRGEITPGEPAGGGAYVSVPSWRRTIPQRHRLIAGRCPDCGALAFPPEGACKDCGALAEYGTVALPGTGTIEAVTVIGQDGAPPEFVEQQSRSGAYASAVVALDGPEGGTAAVPAQVVGTAPESVAIGDRVRATIRRVYTQEGVTRYGFKMRPAE